MGVCSARSFGLSGPVPVSDAIGRRENIWLQDYLAMKLFEPRTHSFVLCSGGVAQNPKTVDEAVQDQVAETS